jgi:class 3 adenylate cyclase/tetratricopeptide (TPR) repeat protein
MSVGAASIAESSTHGRRRQLTILFSDLSDSTRLAAMIEAEHYAEVLRGLRRIYEDVVPRFGGTIVRIQGDGMLAIFGYPEAGEDDGRRAAHAALELHANVRNLQCEPPLPRPWLLSLHSGIHAGLVLLDEGDLLRGRFDLLGNAPNIAARLSELAEHDQILVSEPTLGTELHFFETGAARRVELKGAAEPLTVHRILAPAPVQTRYEASTHRGLQPFVGRARELQLLEGELQRAMSGVSGQIAIAAAAGLGKTRLVEEFLRIARARDCRIHRGYCESNLGAPPLQPILQILRSLFGLDTKLEPGAAADLLCRELEALGEDFAPYHRSFLAMLSLLRPADSAASGSVGYTPPAEAAAALGHLFDRLSASAPQVLFLDDWQWADDATRHVVDAIRQLPQRPVLIVLTTRGLSAGADILNGTRTIELAPFNEEEAAQAVAVLMPGTDPFLAGSIGRHSGGNPLYIEELCHAAVHDHADRRWRRVLAGAAWLDTLIESRVSRLPVAQTTLLRAAAVIGNVVPAWLLECVTGVAADHPHILGLAQLDFLFQGEQQGTLRFKHGITRDVIYAAVGLQERVALHRRIANALREWGSESTHEEALEALAYHCGAAGEHEAAADFAERAAEKAMSISALDRAQALYRAALIAIDQLPPTPQNTTRWSELARRLGFACVFDPSREHLDVLSLAAQRATERDDQLSVAHAQYWLGYVYYGLGESRAAIAHCERGLYAARHAGDDPLTVQIRATLGQALAAACEYDRALQLLDEAIEIKKRHRNGKRPAVGLSYSLACRASVLGDRGEFAHAQECFDDALDAVQGARHEVEGSLFCWRSAVYLWQGCWPEAQQAAAHAQHVAQRVKSLYLFAMARALAAYAQWVQCRDVPSLQTIVEATSWIEARERGQYISLNYGWLADAQVTVGDFAAARHSTARALIRSRGRDSLGVAMAHRAMARASATASRRGVPSDYLDRAMKVARARGARHEISVTHLCRAEIEALAGRRSAAIDALDLAQTGFESMRMQWHLEQAERLRRRL